MTEATCCAHGVSKRAGMSGQGSCVAQLEFGCCEASSVHSDSHFSFGHLWGVCVEAGMIAMATRTYKGRNAGIVRGWPPQASSITAFINESKQWSKELD